MITNIKCFVSGMCETNSYIIEDENKNCVIVDPEGGCDKYVKYLKENELNPMYILLTHAHFDHLGAIEGIKKKALISVVVGEHEKEVLTNPRINLSAMLGAPKSYEADKYVSDGEEIEAGSMKFKVMYTPGHTCGSVCYICEDIILSGDTLFQGSCGRTDFPTGDWPTMSNSLQLLKNLEGDYRVFSGHGPATTLDRERKTNMFMR